MAVIDIGPGAINRETMWGVDNTSLDAANPANDTGILDIIEIWAQADLVGCKVGTFYGSGTDYTSRDVETIGPVASGSKQTFSGLDIDVETGDFIGLYATSGLIERDFSGFTGIYYKIGDQFGTGQQTYSLYDGDGMSIYGTGETEAAAAAGGAGSFAQAAAALLT